MLVYRVRVILYKIGIRIIIHQKVNTTTMSESFKVMIIFLIIVVLINSFMLLVGFVLVVNDDEKKAKSYKELMMIDLVYLLFFTFFIFMKLIVNDESSYVAERSYNTMITFTLYLINLLFINIFYSNKSYQYIIKNQLEKPDKIKHLCIIFFPILLFISATVFEIINIIQYPF